MATARTSNTGGAKGKPVSKKKPQPKAANPITIYAKNPKATQVKRARNEINREVGEQAVKIVHNKKNADVVVRPMKSAKAAKKNINGPDGGYQGQYRKKPGRDTIVVATNKQQSKAYGVKNTKLNRSVNKEIGKGPKKTGWPNGMSAMSNLTEHEIGHALGLNHTPNRSTLMGGGTTLDKSQIRKIRKRVK